MKNIVIFFILLGIGFNIDAQNSGANQLIIPQEQIYLHQNTTFAISGEYIYYKIYCLFNKSLSNFSKIAYVELVANDHTVIFRHKIRLNKGLGQGEFFIPTSVPSGNYKILAYTQWMKNGNVLDFYQNDLLIINPFQVAPQSNDNQNFVQEKGGKNISQSNFESNNEVTLKLINESYGTREKVTLDISALKEEFYGNYSLSVRKVEEISLPKRMTAKEFKMDRNVTSLKIEQNTKQYQIPEIRGELVSGIVLNKNSNLPVKNSKVALSIPGMNYVFKIANSNSDGVFYFNLEAPYERSEAIIQIIDDTEKEYKVEIKEPDPIDYSELEFNLFAIDKDHEDLILERSVNNQIENAFASVKVDSIIQFDKNAPFYNKSSNEYFLDDYTRFPTIQETILEVIEQASTRKKNNKLSIHVRDYESGNETGIQSLLLVDGLFVEDHGQVISAKASKIKKISVVTEQYIYSSTIFGGIMILESFNGDFLNSLPGYQSKITNLFRPLDKKGYFKQKYNNVDSNSRIPDLRPQLVWEPNLLINKNKSSYIFFTSDVKGTYEIILEGISLNGKAVSLNKQFMVK